MRIIIELDEDDTEPIVHKSTTGAATGDAETETSATDAGSPTVFSEPAVEGKEELSDAVPPMSAADAGAPPDGEGVPEPIPDHLTEADVSGEDAFGGDPSAGEVVTGGMFVDATNAGGPADSIRPDLGE